jgi:hypothetical protein
VSDNLFDFLDDDACEVENVKSRAYPEGKTYAIASPDAITGAKLTALADISRKSHLGLQVSEADMAKLNLNDEQEHDFMREVLGDTLDELRNDGVSHVRIQKILQYAYIYFAMGPEVAAKAAREGLLSGGKAFAPQLNRAQRRQQQREAR